MYRSKKDHKGNMNKSQRRNYLKTDYFITCWVCLENKGAGQGRFKLRKIPEDLILSLQRLGCAAVTNNPKISEPQTFISCSCHLTVVAWWVCVHHTASGTQDYGTATIWNFDSHRKDKKSSKGSQACNLMLQPQVLASTCPHNLLAGANPMAPSKPKGARKLNTTTCLEMSGKPQVRCDFVISLHDALSTSHDSKSNWPCV